MNSPLLDKINSPEDIKLMSCDELNALADEIRQALIHNISVTGGHLASNLGIVELTIALHKVFDSPKDKIVFDVGHQCYVHKILTGRINNFSTLRKKDGLSGFPNPSESEHDVFKTGHSSTSISSALGIASAMDLDNNDSFAVAVIGDGSMTGGLAFEGLNNAGNSNKNLIVILNDNKMSISKNVGAIAKALTIMRNKRSYFKFKDFLANFTVKIPFVGKPIYRRLVRFKSAVKSYFYSYNIFEGMGFKYIGPVEGHNIELLTGILNRAKSLKQPVLVHVKTKKGKGYSYAENSPHDFHGVGVFDIDTGSGNSSSQLSYTDVFGKTIVDIAQNNPNVCAITAAMGPSCGLKKFKELYPKRFFDVGIAESHAVTFASGLAKMGKIPVFAVYSTFLQRSYDQIIHDISLQNIKAVFAVDRAGFVGEDGETHQGLFDIPMLLPIPNINIFSPTSASELDLFLKRAINIENNSSIIRYPKGNCINYSNYPFDNTSNDYQLLSKGFDSIVISYGREIFEVLETTSGKPVDLLKLNLINSFDQTLLQKLLIYKNIIFVEECYKIGGVGMLLESQLHELSFKGKFCHIAIKNEFVKHSTQKQSIEAYGLCGKSLSDAIEGVIKCD